MAPYQPFFEELIAHDPDITLFELDDALTAAEGVGVHYSSIAALLSRLGFTKKIPLSVNAGIHQRVKEMASERHRARVKHIRQPWLTGRTSSRG